MKWDKEWRVLPREGNLRSRGKGTGFLYNSWEITGYFQHLDKEVKDKGENSEEISAMAPPLTMN